MARPSEKNPNLGRNAARIGNCSVGTRSQWPHYCYTHHSRSPGHHTSPYETQDIFNGRRFRNVLYAESIAPKPDISLDAHGTGTQYRFHDIKHTIFTRITLENRFFGSV